MSADIAVRRKKAGSRKAEKVGKAEKAESWKAENVWEGEDPDGSLKGLARDWTGGQAPAMPKKGGNKEGIRRKAERRQKAEKAVKRRKAERPKKAENTEKGQKGGKWKGGKCLGGEIRMDPLRIWLGTGLPAELLQ